MALKKQIIKSIYGKNLIFDNAYIQIVKVFGDKENIDLTVSIYDNSAKLNLLDIKYFNFKPSVEEDSCNFIKQGYEYLKTLDEFLDCVNILEEGQY